MKRQNLFSSVLLFACAAGSLFLFSMEMRPFVNPRFAELKSEGVVSQAALGHGVSSYSKEIIMKDCLQGLIVLAQSEMFDIKNAMLAEKCRLRSAQVAEKTPTDSFAWAVNALASALLGKTELLNTALVASQKVGPNEQWIARRRVEIAEMFLVSLDAAARSAHDADLTLLAGSYRGVRYLARRYVTNPDFRSRITTVVEKLPADQQRMFLANIRRAMRENET